MPQLDCEIGFELRATINKRADDGVGVENGEILLVRFEGVEAPLPMTVTKAVIEGERKILTVMSPMIVSVSKE